MVGPSPYRNTTIRKRPVTSKASLRSQLRKARDAHVAALPGGMHALLFLRPPAPLLDLVAPGALIGVYDPTPAEAPALPYARWFAERGHRVALPWFARRDSAMAFKVWDNPFEQALLVPDPLGARQPPDSAADALPDVVFCPLLGFTAGGRRLGQGGGHYDRYLAAHPQAVAIGLAWDCQLHDTLPAEPHDVPLRAVVTPTRLYGPF